MGAAKYAERNWERGMPFSRCVASLKRHVMKYQQGLRDEDHLAAIMFNAMALIHYEEMINRGVLPAELNDMPVYQAKPLLGKERNPSQAIPRRSCWSQTSPQDAENTQAKEPSSWLRPIQDSSRSTATSWLPSTWKPRARGQATTRSFR